jgi:hypothetical protein
VRTIWKYELSTGLTTIALPAANELRHVDSDPSGLPSLWFEVNTTAPMVNRTFLVVGTGHDIPTEVRFVGSLKAGPFMWHVYEVAP